MTDSEDTSTTGVPLPDALQLLRREAENRSGGWKTALGLLVGPLLMGGAWVWTHDVKLVRLVGYWLFCLSSILIVVGYMGFSKYKDKIKQFRQQYSVTVPGIMGPVKQPYNVKYDFSKFTGLDYENHKKMHFWGCISIVGCFITFSHFYTSYFF
jgi:hypothetical protein